MMSPTMTQKHGLNAKTAAVWAVVGAIATLLLIPYIAAMMPALAAKVQHAKAPLPLVIAAQSVQAAVVFFILTWLGLTAGSKIGLGSPLVASLFGGPPAPRSSFAVAAGLGLGVGAVVLGLQRLAHGVMPPAAHGEIAAWKGFLASFYGGIAEELQLRCFVMSVVARGLVALKASRGPAIWIANVLAALLFGAGHLPAAAAVYGLTPVVVAVIVSLNAMIGILCGALYAKRGLEHAMVAHFAGDIILHVLG